MAVKRRLAAAINIFICLKFGYYRAVLKFDYWQLKNFKITGVKSVLNWSRSGQTIMNILFVEISYCINSIMNTAKLPRTKLFTKKLKYLLVSHHACYRKKQGQQDHRSSAFHSCNYHKWLPYQILDRKTLMNIQIDPQTTDIWLKKAVCYFVREGSSK